MTNQMVCMPTLCDNCIKLISKEKKPEVVLFNSGRCCRPLSIYAVCA